MASTFPLSLSFYSLYSRHSYACSQRDGPCWIVKLRFGDSKSTKERGLSVLGSLGSSCRYKRFILPWLLYLAQYKIFFSLPYTISIFMSPSPSKLGRQPCLVASLLVCVSGCSLGLAGGGGGGVAWVDPSHTTIKKRGFLPYICSMTRNNKSCLFCVSLKLIPPVAATPSFLERRKSRLAIYVTRIFVPLVTKCTYSRIHIWYM
jgi:hypothetical protein